LSCSILYAGEGRKLIPLIDELKAFAVAGKYDASPQVKDASLGGLE